jgi:hypothetical protein
LDGPPMISLPGFPVTDLYIPCQGMVSAGPGNRYCQAGFSAGSQYFTTIPAGLLRKGFKKFYSNGFAADKEMKVRYWRKVSCGDQDIMMFRHERAQLVLLSFKRISPIAFLKVSFGNAPMAIWGGAPTGQNNNEGMLRMPNTDASSCSDSVSTL